MATSAGDAYVYDDYGRTVEATGNGVTQTFGYDATDVRVTVDGIDQLWDRNGGLPTLISTGVGDNYVHTAGIARDGDQWLLTDAIGSVRATVDDTGATVGSQDFTVYGEQLTGTGSFGFAGEQADLTGQLHLRARQYNPTLGRFTSVDPVQPGAPGTTGYNLYTYSANNPTTWTDPSGESVISEYAALVRDRARAAAVFAQVNTGRFILWQSGLGALGNCGLGVAEEGIEELLSYSSNNEYSSFAIAATVAYGCASGAADGIGPEDPAQAGRPRSTRPEPTTRAQRGVNGSVDELETGPYQPLAARSQRDGLTPDHIPSHAARRANAERDLGRPLTPQEERVLRNSGNCLVVRTCDHLEISRTFGGRNSASQIERDSQDLRAAAEADLQVWRDFYIAEGYDPVEVDRAIADLHALNEADGVYGN